MPAETLTIAGRSRMRPYPARRQSCPRIASPAGEMLLLHFQMQATDDKKHTVKHNQSTLHRWSVWDSGSCLLCHGKATVLRQMAEGTGNNWDSRGPGDCRVSIFEDPCKQDNTRLSGMVKQRCSGWGWRPPNTLLCMARPPLRPEDIH